MELKLQESAPKQNALVLDVLEAVRGKVGLDFLEALTQSVAVHLNFEHVFVGRLQSDGSKIDTIANWANGEHHDNFTYELNGTPCEKVLDNNYCVYHDKVAELFPDDPDLKDLNICGYAGYPLTNAGGRIIGLFSIMARKPLVSDQSIYELLEFYSQRAALELERLDHEETMRKALFETERANLAKSEFLANMSHDLRTPLNAINGFSQLLEAELHGPLAYQYKDYAILIHQAGNQLQRMIDDILIMSKLEAGRIKPNSSHVDIEHLLNSTVEGILSEARYQNSVIRIECQQNMQGVLVDQNMLVTVVRRLIESAADANKEEEDFVTTLSAGLEADNSVLKIRIMDNGASITEDRVEQVLTPFDRGNPALSKGKAERGIALFLAATVVDLIGGSLSLVSNPPRGTEITVSIPA